MATETATATDQKFEQLPIGKLQESKTNPRRNFDAKGIDDLAASLKSKGMIQPIVARPQNGHFEIVAGARRYRAAKKAGLEVVPTLVRDLSDDDVLEIQVIENLQRQDVHPLEEAEGYQALLKKGKLKVEDLAGKVGKSISYIWQRIKLIELVEPAKKAFLEERITAAHAVLIARLTPAQQKEALEVCLPEAWIDSGGTSVERRQETQLPVRVLGQWIKDQVQTDLKRAPWDLGDQHLIAKAGACTICPKRSGNAPGLFPEIQNDKTCTDRECFQSKLKAFFQRKKKELVDQGHDSYLITETQSYNSDSDADHFRGEVLWPGKWKRVGSKKCKHPAKGIFCDGKQRGEVIDICAHPSCKVHCPGVARPSQPAQAQQTPAQREAAQRKENARELKEELEKKIKQEAFRQICNKVREVPKKLIAALLYREIEYGDVEKELVDEVMPGGSKLNEKPFIEKLTSGPDVLLAKMAVAIAVSGDVHDDGLPIIKLSELAKDLGINLQGLEKGIRGKFEAEQREAAEKAKGPIRWINTGSTITGKVTGTGKTYSIEKVKVGGKTFFKWTCRGAAGAAANTTPISSLETAKAQCEENAKRFPGKKS